MTKQELLRRKIKESQARADYLLNKKLEASKNKKYQKKPIDMNVLEPELVKEMTNEEIKKNQIISEQSNKTKNYIYMSLGAIIIVVVLSVLIFKK